MRKIVLLVLLSFAACAAAVNAATAGHGSSGSRDWRLPSGIAPSQAEYQIFVSACKNKMQGTGGSNKIRTCLSNDFGLQHIQ